MGWGGGGEESIPFPYPPGILSFNILIFVKFEVDTDIGMGQSWSPTHRDCFRDGHKSGAFSRMFLQKLKKPLSLLTC